MIKYIIKRLFLTVLSLFILFTLLFFLLQAIPGYPIEKSSTDTLQAYEEILRQRGLLDDPFTQYARFWENLFCNNVFGERYNSTDSVVETFAEPILFTMMIAIPAFLISAFLGILLGTISAYKRGKWQDVTINAFAVLFASVPSFVMALFLMQIAGKIGLPISFVAPGSDGYTTDAMILSIITPVLSLILASTSATVYFTRNELVEVFEQEYIKTALAKGMTFQSVLFKHAMRNAMIPILFSLLPNLIIILSGSFIIERFFNVPGSALEVINAITEKEIYVVLFSAMLFSGIYFLLQIIFDVLSTIIDPRIKLVESSNKSFLKMIKAKKNRTNDSGVAYLSALKQSFSTDIISINKSVLEVNSNLKLIPIIPSKPNLISTLNIDSTINKSMFKLDDFTKRNYIDSSGKPSTRWKDVFKRFFSDKAAIIFVILFALIVLSSMIIPAIYNTNPNASYVDGIKNLGSFLPPRIPFLGVDGTTQTIMTQTQFDTWADAGAVIKALDQTNPNQILVEYNPYTVPALKDYYPILGTGPSGEDWNNKLWYATSYSLLFAIVVAAISTLLGAIYGSIAGYNAGKAVDIIMMRFVEIISGVPTIVWILIFALVFSGGTLSTIVVGAALVLVSWIWPAISTRIYIMKIKDADYIDASRTLGASASRLIFSHLIPNISGKLMVRFVNRIPVIIFFETSLVFLGLKAATDVNLGSMIDVARTTNYFYLLIGPASVIVLITLSSQIIANAFNDSLDPRIIRR